MKYLYQQFAILHSLPRALTPAAARTSRLVTIAALLISWPAAAQLTLTGRTPALNQRSAPVGSNVALTFSTAVNSSTTGGIRLFGSHTGRRSVGTTGGGTSTVTLDPTADFRPGELLYVTVPSTVQSTGGSFLSPAQVYQFTAAAPTVAPANFGGYVQRGDGHHPPAASPWPTWTATAIWTCWWPSASQAAA